MTKVDGTKGESNDPANDNDTWTHESTTDLLTEVLEGYDAALVVGMLPPVGVAPPLQAASAAAHQELSQRVRTLADAAHQMALRAIIARTAHDRTEAVGLVRTFVSEAQRRSTVHFNVHQRFDPKGSAVVPTAADLTEALTTLERVLSRIGTRAVFEYGLEVLGDAQRELGALETAQESREVRVARGVMSLARVQGHVAHTESRGEVWDGLLETGARCKRTPELAPFAAWLVFLDAVRAKGFGEEELKREELRSFAEVGADFVANTSEYDGPRTIASKALKALGHDPAKFSNPSAVAKSRATRKGKTS